MFEGSLGPARLGRCVLAPYEMNTTPWRLGCQTASDVTVVTSSDVDRCERGDHAANDRTDARRTP